MLFSAIRAKGGFNNNPTVSQFEAAYKSIIVHSKIKSSSSANCMALDDTTILRVSSSNIKVKDTQIQILIIRNQDEVWKTITESYNQLQTSVSYLGPYDTNSVTEAITSQPKPHTFYEVENDQQHTSYENITSEKQLIPKLIETSMPQKKLPKVSKTREPRKKLFENINDLTNHLLSSYSTKESFINDNNNLKRKHADIKLVILEIEKILAVEKLACFTRK
ncbi:hypothetical protein QTP88_000130 [Uroleucon formosanum]